MKKMFKRMLALLLCAVMVLGTIPAATTLTADAKTIEENADQTGTIGGDASYGYLTFETFDDLKTIAAGSYDTFMSVVYNGSESVFTISEDLTLSQNIFLSIPAKVLIPQGVTLSFTRSSTLTSSHDFQTLEINGVMNGIDNLNISQELTVNGTLNMDGWIWLETHENANAISGYENIHFAKSSQYAAYTHNVYSVEDFYAVLDQAAIDPYGLKHTVAFTPNDSTVTFKSFIIPQNAVAYLMGRNSWENPDITYVIPNGVTVTVNGTLESYASTPSCSCPLIQVSGNLVNHNLVDLEFYEYEDYMLVFTDSGKYSGQGVLKIRNQAPDGTFDWTTKVSGLDTTGLEVLQSGNTWTIRPVPEETPIPAAPTLKASNVASTGKIKLTWNKVEGAEKYEVYRATSKTGTYSLLKTMTGTSLTNTSVDAGKTYYYKICAVASDGTKSEFSDIVSRTCDLSRPEVTVTNVASTGKIKITWEKVDGATKYQVYRATSKDGTYSLLKTVTGTSLTNTSVEVGKTYYYKVKAIHENSAANSAYSSVVSRTCDLAQPKVTVTNVASSGKIKITWEKVDGATKYQVYRATSKDGTYSLLKTVTGTSLTNTSVEVGKTYYYKVKAIHSTSAANSAYSSVVSRTCDLARPTAKVALNSKGKPVISWGKVEGAVKYTLYIYDANGNLLKTSSTTGLKMTHSSAVKGTTYKYRVVAVHSNSAANSAKSSTVSITSK